MFSRFWLFQVIHGFLIVTLSSGLITALSNLGETASSVPTLLAAKLPAGEHRRQLGARSNGNC